MLNYAYQYYVVTSSFSAQYALKWGVQKIEGLVTWASAKWFILNVSTNEIQKMKHSILFYVKKNQQIYGSMTGFF